MALTLLHPLWEDLTIQAALLKFYIQFFSPIFSNFKQHEEKRSAIKLINAIATLYHVRRLTKICLFSVAKRKSKEE